MTEEEEIFSRRGALKLILLEQEVCYKSRVHPVGPMGHWALCFPDEVTP